MLETIRAFLNTPLPTLLVVFGVVLLLLAFGVRITGNINTSGLNKPATMIIGFALLVAGLVPYISGMLPKQRAGLPRTKDPFLVYYLFCVPGVIVLCWVALRFPSGDMQVSAVKLSFILVAALVTMTILWRALDVYFYLARSRSDQEPSPDQVPLALYERANYLPYFLLLGTAVLIITWMIFGYTREEVNTGNRFTIYTYFAYFCVYLLLCRMAWEIVDYIARVRRPAP